MQKSRHDRFLIQLQIRKNDCDAKRMNNVWLSRFTYLSLMGALCNPIGLLNHRNIVRRVIFAHPFDQILIKLFRTHKFFDTLDTPVIQHKLCLIRLFLFFFRHSHMRTPLPHHTLIICPDK